MRPAAIRPGITAADFDSLGSAQPRALEELAFDGHGATAGIDGSIATAVEETTGHFPDFRAPTVELNNDGERRFSGAMINDGFYYLVAFYTLEPTNYLYHVFDSQMPGAVDTSGYPSDNNNNPNTINSFFGCERISCNRCGSFKRSAASKIEAIV